MSRTNLLKLPCLILFAVACFSCAKESPRVSTYPLFHDLEDADLNWDTRLVDFGTSTAHPALISGWSEDKRYPDGTTTLSTVTNRAAFYINVLTITDKEIQVRCRSLNSEHASFGLLVNGERTKRQKIDATFRDYTFAIPGSALHTGRNQITFTGPDVEFDSIRILQTATPSAAFASPAIEFVQAKRRLSVPVASSIGIYWKVPQNAMLRVSFGLPKETTSGSQARFAIFLDEDGKPRTELMSRTIKRGFFYRLSDSALLSLSAYNNHIVRLVFQVDPGRNSIPPQVAYWNVPEISLPFQASSSTVSPTTAPVQNAAFHTRGTNVILYVIDALRADHLEPYGYTKKTSPNIVAFTHDAALFQNAFSNADWTRASVATILTGLYPSSHLTEGRLDMFPSFATSIQKELKTAGFYAIGVTTNGNISPDFNFKKDFDQYIHLREDSRTIELHKQSSELFQTLNSLVSIQQKPFFLYVHATDPHEPHTVQKEFLDVPTDCKINDEKIRRPMNSLGPKGYSAQEVECVRSLYDGEIRQADHYFGKFLERLKSLNFYNDSLIILTADHGESLYEHHFWGHGQSLYQSELHVPLIVHFPGARFAGKKISEPVRHIDLFPTILHTLSLKIPDHVSGRSFLPLLNGRTFDTPVFAETRLDGLNRKAVIWRNLKMLENQRGVYQYYDLGVDPEEKQNDYWLHPVFFGYLKTVLHGWSRVQEQARNALHKGPQAVIDPEMEETLKALGYLK